MLYSSRIYPPKNIEREKKKKKKPSGEREGSCKTAKLLCVRDQSNKLKPSSIVLYISHNHKNHIHIIR